MNGHLCIRKTPRFGVILFERHIGIMPRLRWLKSSFFRCSEAREKRSCTDRFSFAKVLKINSFVN